MESAVHDRAALVDAAVLANDVHRTPLANNDNTMPLVNEVSDLNSTLHVNDTHTALLVSNIKLDALPTLLANEVYEDNIVNPTLLVDEVNEVNPTLLLTDSEVDSMQLLSLDLTDLNDALPTPLLVSDVPTSSSRTNTQPAAVVPAAVAAAAVAVAAVVPATASNTAEACDVCAGRCAAPTNPRKLSLPMHIPRAVEFMSDSNDDDGGFLQLSPESAERVHSDVWARGLDPHRMPPPEVDTLVRVATLGTGREGEVMLAVAPDGAVCAVKVPHHRPGTPVSASEDAANAKRLLRERNAWHQLWDRHDVRLQRLAGRTTLVMPYVRVAEPEHWQNPRDAATVMAAAEAAVAQIARAGYTYFAERKHVGLYDGPNGKVVAIFIDLSSLKVRPPGTTEADALKEMLAILHNSAVSGPPFMPAPW